MLPDVFTEKADIREIQLEGNLFNGEVGLQKIVLDVGDGALCNPVHSRATALFLADRAEVLWGNQQLLGIVSDFTLSIGRMMEHSNEVLKQPVFL